MPINLRRARGVLLRLIRRRMLSVALGVALVLPALWLQFGASAPPWWADGASLLLGATGVALIWNGLTGARPDWIDSGRA